jgi:glycosyltransferase involved in cell wall biosynthesis
MGYIGSFFHYEGLHLLVQAMAGLAAEFPDLRLLLAGEGEVTRSLKKIAQDSGVTGGVLLPGRIATLRNTAGSTIYGITANGYQRNSPGQAVKASRIVGMGKPLLATDIGGHRKIANEGSNGILFESENVRDLVAKCQWLTESKEMRLDLGARGRKWVEGPGLQPARPFLNAIRY